MAASYPGSVKTFATRSAGQTIDASHINDLQDEVNAIEAGLLNGTAPLTSSNAAVNTLSVSSNSTFAIRPFMPAPEMAVVFLQSSVTLGSSAASTIAWTAQNVITNSSMHSTGTNPERLIPQTTGVYRIDAQVSFAQNSTGSRAVVIADSSNTALGAGRAVALSSQAVVVTAMAYKRFDVTGGYVTCRAENESASTLSLSSGVGVTWFSLTKL